jgi:uncharacterized protein YllA (UPF0747 family)
MVVAAQRREIKNILKSYTGYYDLFAELLQNALDALGLGLPRLHGLLAFKPQRLLSL